jgi:hypothetical protein
MLCQSTLILLSLFRTSRRKQKHLTGLFANIPLPCFLVSGTTILKPFVPADSANQSWQNQSQRPSHRPHLRQKPQHHSLKRRSSTQMVPLKAVTRPVREVPRNSLQPSKWTLTSLKVLLIRPRHKHIVNRWWFYLRDRLQLHVSGSAVSPWHGFFICLWVLEHWESCSVWMCRCQWI